MEPADDASVRELEKYNIQFVTDSFHDKLRKIAAVPWLLTNTPLTNRCFHSGKLARAAREFAPSSDVIVAYSSCMAQFVEFAEAPRVMEFGDLDSEKWRQYSTEARGPMAHIYSREAKTLLNYEKRIAKTFDVSLVVSKAEAATFEERTGVRPRIVGNGVDTERFKPNINNKRTAGLIVFTGIMNYLPNVDGCVRFAKQILPKIRARVPNATFRIVGAQPSREILNLQIESPGAVEVTGAVPETADHLRSASVAVAPLRLGRGLQNKVLEAMACATPVVASSNASAGVDAVASEHFLLADGDDETAAAVVQLLESPGLANSIGAAARARVEERYRWERALADYDGAIRAAIENKHSKK